MTVDDLVKTYIIAHYGADNGPRNRERYRAGVTAIVRALRDELNGNWIDCRSCEHNAKLFNEILGDAGAAKVAGGSTREDGPGGVEQAVPALTPATDAAPAVCEWTPYTDENLGANWWRSCRGVRHRYSFDGHHPCSSCGKTIAFTEAK